MKALVTGGSGFIGSNLIKKLQELAWETFNFDQAEGFDITNTKQLEKIIKNKFDIIYHLAGFSGSERSNRDKIKSFKINTLATVNLLELASKYSPKSKLILSSSRLEYGVPHYLPVDEKHPKLPTSIYGLSKLAAAEMALVFHQTRNLDVIIFRTSNVYGPHSKTAFSGYNIINNFVDIAKENGILTVYGEGKQERDYLFIDDFVDAFILSSKIKKSGQIFNLGFGKGIEFRKMIELIVKIVGKGKIKYVKWPKDFHTVETGSYVSDITKFMKETGFRPKVNFEEGVRRTAQSTS